MSCKAYECCMLSQLSPKKPNCNVAANTETCLRLQVFRMCVESALNGHKAPNVMQRVSICLGDMVHYDIWCL